MTRLNSADAQTRALDPGASVWVSASAGSGKTQLLSDRVIRLMLGGAAPGRVLCLTFTRAAAAEMASRINGKLARFATEPDNALQEGLAALLGRPASLTEGLRARRLFAQVLDVPGGLPIMTIHAFCQSLLRRFPIEADLAPQFDVLDEAGQRDLIANAALRLFAEVDPAHRSTLGDAWRRLSPTIYEDGFPKLIGALRRHRDALARLRAAHGDLAAAMKVLYRRLDVPFGTDERAIIAEAVTEGRLDRQGLSLAVAALNEHGGSNDAKQAAGIAAWLENDAEGRMSRFGSYLGVFLTKDGTKRKALATKAVVTKAPGAHESLLLEQARIAATHDRMRRAALAANTAAVLTVEARFASLYATEKVRAAALDFDDQIDRAWALLVDKAAGAWVLYKLDGGIEHILVDEAQDTAPGQWRIVEALVDEFYAGEGAREGQRTLFAVGDEKQSIFSFQGADLRALEAVRERLMDRARSAAIRFDDVPLVRSFRSTAPILRLVDAVFADEAVRAGVARAGEPVAHTLVREGQAGRVELWPLIEPSEPVGVSPRAAPLEQEQADDPERRFAEAVAGQIERWLDPRTDSERADAMLPSRGRPMRAGDILVLARRRRIFGPTLIGALKARNIAVAGVDRMVLTEQLAVRDLMALGDALLLPQDDLTFACLLKSPLIGFDDERLFALAHDRGEASLWQALGMRCNQQPAYAEAHAFFADLLARVDFAPPFELFGGLLARGGRAALLRRLGPEANDAIDEFLARALDHERSHPPSLQGFLHWLRSSEGEVKRDGEPARDEVRVMTVHGAKGLQAPVVILSDTTSLPHRELDLLWSADNAPSGALPLYPGHIGLLDDAGRAALDVQYQRQDEEFRRLLYVALTRAEDRLYVGGHVGPKGPPDGCWYRLIEAGFDRFEGAMRVGTTEASGFVGEARRFDVAQTRASDKAEAEAKGAAGRPDLPPWALRPPAEEAPPRRQISASAWLKLEVPIASPLDAAAEGARRRGQIVHRLLEWLPDLEPSARPKATERYLGRTSLALPSKERKELAAIVRTAIEAPEMAALLGADGLSEVPLAAEINGVVLSGQIDRLAITHDRVLVIDYKTGGRIPERPEDAPPAYLAQLATYRAILAQLYPDRPIRCGLFYTARPVLHWIQESVLEPFAP